MSSGQFRNLDRQPDILVLSFQHRRILFGTAAFFFFDRVRNTGFNALNSKYKHSGFCTKVGWLKCYHVSWLCHTPAGYNVLIHISIIWCRSRQSTKYYQCLLLKDLELSQSQITRAFCHLFSGPAKAKTGKYLNRPLC